MTSPPPLRPLSLDTGLQSHGNDNLPESPLRRGSSGPSLSPADCRTLKKVLRNVASPPATPSPLEQSDQLFPDGSCAGTTFTSDQGDGYHLVGGEATDTGYEDEDNSMELSDGGETGTDQVITSLGEPASPFVSKSERRLQESVSLHDEKEKMRYSSGQRSSTTKPTKTKRTQKGRTRSRDVEAGGKVEDVMNLPGKCVPPAHSLNIRHPNSDRSAMPADIEKFNSDSSPLQRVFEQGHLEQKPAKSKEVSRMLPVPGPQDQAPDGGNSVLDGSAANDKQTRSSFRLGISGAPSRKVRETASTEVTLTVLWANIGQISQSSTSKLAGEYSPVAPPFAAETFLQVPSTPTTTSANQTPEAVHLQSATNQTVSEMPFTKTLSYFKQHKGVERQAVDECEVAAESAISDEMKQVILYPQEPAFINAISMIPATMFWVTAVPVVKYTGIAVELLIDQLRDAFL